eukprot:12882421-Prorocentrum_lima.AAC.1
MEFVVSEVDQLENNLNRDTMEEEMPQKPAANYAEALKTPPGLDPRRKGQYAPGDLLQWGYPGGGS